jgi:hypothetical protein
MPSEGGGGRRRRRRQVPHLGDCRPHWGADDTLNDAHLHRPTESTLKTASTTDHHHAANLADSFTRHVGTTASTSFRRGRPFGLCDAATGCSVGSPSMLPHSAKAERSGHGTRLSGLADELLRKRESGAEKQERVEKVRCWRRSPRGGAEPNCNGLGPCRPHGPLAGPLF